jgi:hypothetical protein
MPVTAYSRRLAIANLPDTALHVLFTVPPGRTYVVREIDVYWSPTTGNSLRVFDDAIPLRLFDLTGVAGSPYTQWTGRLVFPEAAILGVQLVAPAANVTVSGYDLAA